MNSIEIVKNICKEKKIPIYILEKDLGFANGYIRKLKTPNFPADRLFAIAEYLNVSPEYLQTGKQPEHESTTGEKYYFSDETAQMAQELFDDPDLRILFDAARDSKPEYLRMAAEMLKEFKATNPDG